VALREGQAIGAETRFCDLPAGPMLLAEEPDAPDRAEFGEAVASAFGMRSHEEWWEALFESQSHDAESLIQLLLAYGEEAAAPPGGMNSVRERAMWMAFEAAVARGTAPGDVMIVCGAAHAVRFPAPEPAKLPRLESGPVEFALTPYTFLHLSRRSGTGRKPLTVVLPEGLGTGRFDFGDCGRRW